MIRIEDFMNNFCFSFFFFVFWAVGYCLQPHQLVQYRSTHIVGLPVHMQLKPFRHICIPQGTYDGWSGSSTWNMKLAQHFTFHKIQTPDFDLESVTLSIHFVHSTLCFHTLIAPTKKEKKKKKPFVL